MATEKQRRETARRQLERQLQKRAEQEAARKRFAMIASIVGTLVLIVAVVVTVVVLTSGDDKKKKPSAKDSPTVSGSPSASSTFTAQKTSGPCGYVTADPSSNPSLKNVGLPPDPKPTPTGIVNVEIDTNRGTIDMALDGKNAPCTVQAISYLIQKKFYDNTPCPRVVNSGIFVVQCGSGGKDTSGGPTFTIPDENLAGSKYPAGAIAMANTGQANTGSSQFFVITKDSTTALGPKYTVLGKVTKGLGIFQTVGAGGDDGSSGSVGGGAPKLALTFNTVKIVSVTGGKNPGIGATPTLVPVAN
jgi:peptidyl-prolyl cis-trans isomerase B (cyclophilin B)